MADKILDFKPWTTLKSTVWSKRNPCSELPSVNPKTQGGTYLDGDGDEEGDDSAVDHFGPWGVNVIFPAKSGYL